MTFLFFVIIAVLLIILQTSFLPEFAFFNQCFDLLLTVILGVSLRFSHPASCLGVMLLGCIMDSVSGGPFGLYLSTYLWIYIGVQLFKGFVHSENIVFLYVASIAAVVLENSIILFSLAVRYGAGIFSSPDIGFMGHQVMWTLFVLPILVVLVDAMHRWFLWMIKILVRKGRELNN